MIDRFLYMLEQKIESSTSDDQEVKRKKHGSTVKLEKDCKALLDPVRMKWVEAIDKHLKQGKYLGHLSRKNLAKELIAKLPKTLIFHADNIFTRAVNVFKLTDPRKWDNGKCVGLKPHWQNFEWVKI